jgi:hypothetical protein
MTSEVQAALIGAASGAAFGALASLLVNSLSTKFRTEMYDIKLQLEPQAKAGTRVTARIFNGYDYPMNHAVAYITIYHEKTDVVPPPNNSYDAFIKPPDHVKLVEEDRLCWSLDGNPHEIDIYGGERQSLDVFEVVDSQYWIQIPSERGWGSEKYEDGRRGKARVFLNRKRYEAEIKIVSKDTKAKKFKVAIDPDDKSGALLQLLD